MKYTFIAEEIDQPFTGYAQRKHTIEFVADDLTTLLSMFEDFLKGQGFYLNGTLDVVPEEEFNNPSFDDDEPIIFSSMNDDFPTMAGAQPATDFTFSANIDLSTISTIDLSVEDLSKKSMTNIEERLNIFSTEDKCPVCLIPKKQMEGHRCFDPGCGLGKNNTSAGSYHS